MKFLVFTLCVAFAAAHYGYDYSLEGGYKEEGKYTYHYEAFVNPAQIEDLERNFAKLHFNGTVELHFMKNNKVVLRLKEYNIYECYSDPKNMSGVFERRSLLTEQLAVRHLKKPIKFVYTNGLVQQIFAQPDDPDWSVNTKKGILNMIHVDVTGKDQETGLKDMFTKDEVSIFGICQTTYSTQNYEIVDGRQVRRQIGLNITKNVDFENCTGLGYDIFNKAVQGRNQDQDSNPLKVSATIKHNITGTENRFKIEGVIAKGVYVIYPFAREQGGIPSITLQKLRLLKEEGSLFEREFKDYKYFEENLVQRGKLMMSLPSFHKPSIFPPLQPQDRDRKAVHIRDTIRSFISLIPKEAPVQSVTLVPALSSEFLQIVNSLRDCDVELLGRVWQKCSQPADRKWLVFALSNVQTESSVEFVQRKIPKMTDNCILNFLQGVGFSGQPTRVMLNKMQKICTLPRITSKAVLSQACWISSSNIAKGFCKINKICKSWVEDEILKALQKIPTQCLTTASSCQPIEHLSLHYIISIAENLGRPAFLTALEQIITTQQLPLNVRMHAISACRPIIRISPKRTQLLLLRLFRSFQYDTQLRSLAFSVLMEQPHPHLIQITARHLYTEPSVNIRKYVHETFTQMVKSRLSYNDTVRQTCKTVLKLYRDLYLPSKMTNYRSRHYTLAGQIPGYAVGAEMESIMIANNRSYIPRFSQTRLKATVLGRKFEVFDGQVYMQGIQDYINWMMSMMRPYSFEDEYDEQFINVQKKIDEVNEKTSHRPREPESLIYETQMKFFDKLVGIQELHLNKSSSFLEHLMTHLPEIMRIAKMLSEGKTWTWFKPIMPVEVIYTVPSLVGIPLNYNLSSVVLPYVKSAMKVDIQPDPLKPSFWIQKKKLESIKVTGSQNSNSLTEVRGRIVFRLPFLEVGALTRKIMNTSSHCTGMTSYNFKTAEYNEAVVLPKSVQEVLMTRTESAHFIKATQEPVFVRFVGLGPDQLGKVDIINVTGPCVGQCRHEEWHLRASNGKYLNVQDNKVVLKEQPLKFKVMFHGRNRRIISLYVPGQGFVVLSRKSPNLLVQQTDCGKYFIVDFTNTKQTLIRSLVHLETTPSGWGIPDRDEIEEIRRVERLAMKETVLLSEEKYIEKGEVDPTKGLVRLTYITVAPSGIVRLSPKQNQAMNITSERQANYTSILRRFSYGNRSCIGKPWGFNLCAHGYLPQELSRSLLTMIYAPMEYRVTCRPDKDNQVRKITTNGRVVSNTTNMLKYEINTKLVGTPRNIKTEISWYKQDYRLKIDVLPTHFDLLQFQKMCYREHFKPDNYSLKISLHPECQVNHVQADFLAPKQFPRHQMAFRINFTNQALPQFWQRAMSSLSRNVVVPLLRNSSDFWYANRTYYQNTTLFRNGTQRTDVPYNGTTYVRYFLTRNDTMTFKIQSPSESYVWEDVKLNAYIRSFPIGSRFTPVVAKMYWSYGKACCTHSNSTFITFDKVVFNYTLKRQCDHILMRSCYKNMTQFLVLTKRVPGQKNQLKRIVNTFIDRYQIEFIPGPQYSSKPTVRINGKPIQFQLKYDILKDGRPCIYIVWEPKLQNIGLYHVQTGLYVSLRRSFKVRSSISQQFFSKVCGLCGDFNGEPKNEFITPEGQLIRDVQKPKLYDPELEFYQEHLFGNSWFVPGRKCVRDGCKFVRENVKVEADDQPEKYCLTSFKVPQCLKKCTPSQSEQIKVPITCVAKNETSHLNRQLKTGEPISLFTATQKLVPITVPHKCNCPCGNNYKYYENDGEEYEKPSYSDDKDSHWYDLYRHYFDEY